MSPVYPACETLLLTATAGRLYVTFNRPGRRNAMNDRMVAEMVQLVDRLSADRQVRVVIFRGAGGHFCAGGDIKERREQTDRMSTERDPIRERNLTAGRLFQKIAHLSQTTVAMVEGSAMGGGFGLACVMDITLIDAGAKLGMPETTLGIAPAQIAPHVVRRIGLTRARHLALTGARIDGTQAHALGIAQYLFHGAEDGERQLEAVLRNIEGCGPVASAATKEIMRAVERMSDDEIIAYAADWFTRLNKGEEGREGQLAFVEKRRPVWPARDN